MPSSFGRKCQLSTLLRRLNLSNNRISKFPERTILPLVNLEILNLSNNALTEIPFSLFHLTNLVEIELADNTLKALPTKIDESTYGNASKVCHHPPTLGHHFSNFFHQ